jgi:hypothetical protein
MRPTINDRVRVLLSDVPKTPGQIFEELDDRCLPLDIVRGALERMHRKHIIYKTERGIGRRRRVLYFAKQVAA